MVKTKITLKEVKHKFIEIINNNISLEEANNWAFLLIQKQDARDLIYVPREDKDKIWKGIQYLYGIDIQVAPGEYLHCKDDIKEAFIKKFGYQADIEQL